MNHAFVIPAFSTEQNKCVIDCVKSIRKFHASSEIIIVDSDSPDKSYFNEVQKYNVVICNVKNKNRETGAIWHAYHNFPDIEFFFFIQDSLVCNSNGLDLMKYPFSCLRYFPSWDGKKFKGKPGLLETRCGWADDDNSNNDGLNFKYKDKNGLDDRNWLTNKFKKYTPYEIPSEWNSVFGSIFFCHRTILESLVKNGFDKILPTNKMEACVMERAWGIAIEQLGFNVADLSIQKYYLHPGFDDTILFEKNFYLR